MLKMISRLQIVLRRTWLPAFVLGMVLWGMTGARAQGFVHPAWGAPVPPRPESVELARTVPLADMHMHYYAERRGWLPEDIVRLMDRNHVRWGGAVGDYHPDLQALLGPRYIPAIGQLEFTQALAAGGERALQDPTHPIFVRFFSEAEALLASGKVRGFGELHISNLSGPRPANAFERTIPMDSPVVRRIYEIANAHGAFVQIHTNKDPATIDDILRLAAAYPRTTTIVSHCLPRGLPADMRRLFLGAPNVMCELSGGGFTHGLERTFSREGIRSGWLALVEEFPDRVMFGTDPCCGLLRQYDTIVEAMRTKVLAAMRPQTLEMVAYRNAQRLLGLPDIASMPGPR